MLKHELMAFRKMSDDEIKSWYHTEFSEAFAENERKPLEDIFDLIDDGRYEAWGLFNGDKLLGYATLWKAGHIPLVLMDYLGVSKEYRNQGIGAKILEQLKSLNFPIVTESELPVSGDAPEENNIRIRRINFYKRNGFKPAYEMATCGMRWQALLVNTDSMLLEDIMKWHKELYGSERTDVKVPIGKDEIPEMPYWMHR